MKIQINDTNYSYYRQIFIVMRSQLVKLYPPEIVEATNPTEILEKSEGKGKTIAKRALKLGIHDMISQIKDFPADLKKSIDQELIANNLPGLNELLDINSKIVSTVLKRKKIKTLDEFYIIKEEVVDLSSSLTDEQRVVLDKALGDFESSKIAK